MKSIFLFVLLFAIDGVMAQTSYVPPTKTLKDEGYQIGAGVDYFSTSKPVDENGKGTTFSDGEKFTRTQFEFMGYYGATDQLQFGLGARLRQNSSNYFAVPADGSSTNEQEFSATQSGFQSTVFSIMYGFKPVDRLQYTLEGLFRYVPYSNQDYRGNLTGRNQNDIIVGDEGNEVSGGLGVTYESMTNNYYTLRGGLRKPGDNLSNEVYYNAEAAFAWRTVARGWRLGR